MDATQFLAEALTPARGMRRGQALINILQAYRPDLVHALIRADLDPFYDDAKLWPAVAWITANWDTRQ